MRSRNADPGSEMQPRARPVRGDDEQLRRIPQTKAVPTGDKGLQQGRQPGPGQRPGATPAGTGLHGYQRVRAGCSASTESDFGQ